MKIDILNTDGQSTGRSADLPDEIFGATPNEHVLYLAVKQFNAAQRQGTHKAKERGEIAGSTRKIKRQKGTGTARAGSIKSGVFRGGGRIFGPRPRNYSIKLNKKVKRIARVSALSQKLASGGIKVVEDFTMEAPKTGALSSILSNVSGGANRNLLVTADHDNTLYLSSRNLPKSGVVTASNLNTFEILHCQNLILTESAIDKIASTFNTQS